MENVTSPAKLPQGRGTETEVVRLLITALITYLIPSLRCGGYSGTQGNCNVTAFGREVGEKTGLADREREQGAGAGEFGLGEGTERAALSFHLRTLSPAYLIYKLLGSLILRLYVSSVSLVLVWMEKALVSETLFD